MASFYFCIIFVFLFSLPFSLAQNNGNIGVDTFLTAGDGKPPWLSASRDFAFGFRQLQENEFLLSIWYNKIPQQTVVWYPKVVTNGIDIPLSSKGSRIQLNSPRGLELRDPQERLLWSTSNVGDVAGGFLNDTGNLVLFSGGGTYLWESFQYPTDTLLPSQELEIGSMLISRRSEKNFSQGRFYFTMQEDGNFLAYTKSVPRNLEYDAEYYHTNTDDTQNPGNAGLKVVFDGKAVLYVLRRNNETTTIGLHSVPSVSDYYHRVTLNFDGVLSQYYYPRSFSGNATWTVGWTQPDNICVNIIGFKGSGACGYNSICSLDDVKRPVCKCPIGYSLVNPNDEYGSCKPDISQSCDESDRGSAAADIFDFRIVNDTDWPLSDYEQIYPSTEGECRNACLEDWFCAVAIYRSNSCWKKRLPLSNGRIDYSLNVKAFLKFRKRDAPC